MHATRPPPTTQIVEPDIAMGLRLLGIPRDLVGLTPLLQGGYRRLMQHYAGLLEKEEGDPALPALPHLWRVRERRRVSEYACE